MTDYFQGVKDLSELRTLYKKLIKKYHPDNGGDTATCAEINRQYDEVFRRLKAAAGRAAAGDEEAEKETRRKYDSNEDQKIREMINRIVRMNINIEIVGVWIWIDGETYEIRGQLKALGFKWSKNRKKWHWSPYKTGGHRGSKKSFDELRTKYGSAKIKTRTDDDAA